MKIAQNESTNVNRCFKYFFLIKNLMSDCFCFLGTIFSVFILFTIVSILSISSIEQDTIWLLFWLSSFFLAIFDNISKFPFPGRRSTWCIPHVGHLQLLLASARDICICGVVKILPISLGWVVIKLRNESTNVRRFQLGSHVSWWNAVAIKWQTEVRKD